MHHVWLQRVSCGLQFLAQGDVGHHHCSQFLQLRVGRAEQRFQRLEGTSLDQALANIVGNNKIIQRLTHTSETVQPRCRCSGP